MIWGADSYGWEAEPGHKQARPDAAAPLAGSRRAVKVGKPALAASEIAAPYTSGPGSLLDRFYSYSEAREWPVGSASTPPCWT